MVLLPAAEHTGPHTWDAGASQIVDGRRGQQTRAAVRVKIEHALDAGLPPAYDAALFQAKADAVFAHVFDIYWSGGQSVYSAASARSRPGTS